MRKNYIVITGGAGFIGSNLIKYLINKTNFNIISLDKYSTGNKKNEFKDKRIKYIKSDTKNISKTLNLYKKIFILFFTLENFLEYIKVF